MDFADFDSSVAQRIERRLRLFKFDGEMAAVIIDAEELVETRVVFMLGAKLLKERNRLGGIFEQAKRFGFKSKMQFFPGVSAYIGNMFNAHPNKCTDVFLL